LKFIAASLQVLRPHANVTSPSTAQFGARNGAHDPFLPLLYLLLPTSAANDESAIHFKGVKRAEFFQGFNVPRLSLSSTDRSKAGIKSRLNCNTTIVQLSPMQILSSHPD
jgi:hypothetical protein